MTTLDGTEEGRHPDGPDPLWNESWYLDFVTTDGSLGGYLRAGLTANQGVTWLIVAITGPGRPLVVIDDKAAPLPRTDGLEFTTDGYSLAFEVIEPGVHFGVRGSGTASRWDDGHQLLAGGPGATATIALDLTWRTDGQAYRYPVGSRYEVPCLVHGTVTVDGESTAIVGAVGQRDHSWGVRDWEQLTWCWSAARLDDGTRVHVTDLASGDLQLAIGYVQRDGEVAPIDTATVTEELDGAGLPGAARLELDAHGLDLRIEPLAHAPTTIATSDGRAVPFPRSMARFVNYDGRSGVGWIEWNRPRPR